MDRQGAGILLKAIFDLEEAVEASPEALSVLEEVLGTLYPTEQKVLRLRFGLEDGRSRTLEEVERTLSSRGWLLTRDGIRQIEAKALWRLRHPSRSGRLRRFVESKEV